MTSALAGAFNSYTITYNVASGAGADALGNPIETVTTSTFKAILKMAGNRTRPTIAEMTAIESARESDLLLEGICTDPVRLPSSVRTGTRCTVTINGRSGSLYIAVPALSPLEIITDVIGQKFVARFTDG